MAAAALGSQDWQAAAPPPPAIVPQQSSAVMSWDAGAGAYVAAAAAAPQPYSAAPKPLAAAAYGAPQPGFLLPPAKGLVATSSSVPKAPPAARRASAHGEVDSSHQNFAENLALWQERERRFIKGEAERLPLVQTREYYYWNAQGQRVGPLTEDQMRSRFDTRQITRDTFISLSIGPGGEEMAALRVNDYFPDQSAAFISAPLTSQEAQMWLFVDDQGTVQGPFSSEQMRDWFNQGFFNENTKARLAHRTDVGFARLGALFPEGEGAFLTEGNQAAAPPLATRAPPAPPALAQPERQSSVEESGRMLLGLALNSDNPFMCVGRVRATSGSARTRLTRRTQVAAKAAVGHEKPGRGRAVQPLRRALACHARQRLGALGASRALPRCARGRKGWG
jgi:hypothetical protein